MIAELSRHGIELRSLPGDYVLRPKDGSDADEYHTDDLADALAQGLEIAAAQLPEPPGACHGRRSRRLLSRRAFIRRHNAKVAARERKAAGLSMFPKRPEDDRAGQGD